MDPKERIREFLKTAKNVRLGDAEITFFKPDNLDKGQIGYSIDPKGNSLINENEEGSWEESWIVLGTTELADPIFVDLIDDEELTVLTAMHGEGEWSPDFIANSLDAFAKTLDLVHGLSKGRTTSEALEKNPISSKEKKEFLKSVKKLNPDVDLDFWELLVDQDY